MTEQLEKLELKNRRRIGNISELKCKEFLLDLGCSVSEPEECDSCDWVVNYMDSSDFSSEYYTNPSKSLMLQVKRDSGNSHKILNQTSSGQGENRTFKSYYRKDFDIYTIHFTDDKTYGFLAFVPFRSFVLESETIYVNRKLSPNTQPFYWAQDFTFEKAKRFVELEKELLILEKYKADPILIKDIKLQMDSIYKKRMEKKTSIQDKIEIENFRSWFFKLKDICNFNSNHGYTWTPSGVIIKQKSLLNVTKGIPTLSTTYNDVVVKSDFFDE